ncbi:MAG: LacI family DNA-binding transcriptional regulator [Pseudomonadota bacterium]
MARRRRGTGADRQPTMHDVAGVAGVSQMTVSRVMRGTGYISKDVRKAVVRAARDIGYVHNRLAGGNAAYDNPLVGVVVPTLQNRVFTEVLAGIDATLGESHLRPVFGVSEYALETEEDIVFDLLAWRPRGLILSGLEHTEALRQIVQRTGVRVAEIMDSDGAPMSACFGFSHHKVGCDMARHLLRRGYRRFGYVASTIGNDLRATKRFDAFAKTVSDAGASIVARRVDGAPSSMQAGRALTAALLAESAPMDAIYYANDDLAAGGLMHCLATGIDVPGALALAGFNGLGFLTALPMRITTTQTPRHEIGAAAAAWILAEAPESPPVAGPDFTCRLIAGHTT